MPNEEGAPQGGCISVLLSNLYLHYVFDLWFERVVKPRFRGEAYLISYIDDFVVCLQYRDDAERVSEVLRQRLEKFALALEPSKTRLVEFGRFAERDARRRLTPRDAIFLGFTLYCTRNRKGNFKVGRKTEKSRLRRSLACLQELLRDIRHEPVKDQVTHLNQVCGATTPTTVSRVTFHPYARSTAPSNVTGIRCSAVGVGRAICRGRSS